jgi:hypothetical protein
VSIDYVNGHVDGKFAYWGLLAIAEHAEPGNCPKADSAAE